MRTTVNISDDLLARAKVLAAETHRSLGDVIDDALRTSFDKGAVNTKRRRVKLVTDGGSGLQPGVDLEDKDSLSELLGDNRLPDAAG